MEGPASQCIQIAVRDGTFDACSAERVFIHLDEAEEPVVEIARAVRPGVHVMVIEPDHETISGYSTLGGMATEIHRVNANGLRTPR